MPQTLQWTVLPNGHSGGRSRVSLFVTPRLSGAPTLAAFTDWINWPKLSSSLQFTLHVAGQTLPNATLTRIAPPTAAQLTAAEALNWWQSLFPGNTVVQSGEAEKFNSLPILSYPVASVASAMKLTYGMAGIYQIQGGFSRQQCAAMAQAGQIFGQGRKQLALQRFKGRTPIANARSADPAGSLALLRMFHGDLDRKTTATKPTLSRAARPGIQIEADAPDFHQRISLLGEYPALLRAFGLIIDLDFPSSTVTDGAPVWVEVSGPFAMAPTQVSPRTVVGTNFRPKPRSVIGEEGKPDAPEWDARGYLKLSQPVFSVLPFDVDGGAVKWEAFLRNAVQALAHSAPDTPDRSATPSLRNAGLALCRLNRAAALAQSLDTAAGNIDASKGATPPTLYFDDLVQGLRVDVREVPTPPAAKVAPPPPSGGGGGLPAPDLGKMTPTMPHLDVLKGNLTPLKRAPIKAAPAGGASGVGVVKPLTGSLAGAGGVTVPKPGGIPAVTGPAWNSLCKRAGTYIVGGKSIKLEDEGWIGPAVAKKDLDGKDALGLHEALFHWDDWSLVVAAPQPPKLPASPTGGNAAALPMPPEPPGWALRTEFSVAGTLPVLRYGRTYEFRVRGVDLAGNSPDADDFGGDHSATSEGYYARFEPVGSPALIPRRDLNAKAASAAAFVPLTAVAGESNDRLVIRSDADKPPTLNSDRFVAPPRADFSVAKAHGVFDKDGKPSPAAAPLITKLGAAMPDVVTGSTLTLPYLAEPLARAAVMISDLFVKVGAVPAAQPWVKVPFQSGSDVNTAQPFLLRLTSVADGVAPTVTNATSTAMRTFAVGLSPGQMIRLRLSSTMGAADLDLMALWNWLEDTLDGLGSSPADLAKAKALYETIALAGLNDMLTPGRLITLVHAVKRPLLVPKFTSLKAYRSEGNTFAAFAGTVNCDAKTSAKLDVWARWSEPVDDASTTTPDKTRLDREAVAFDLPLNFHSLQDPTAPQNDRPLAAADALLVAWATDKVPVNIDEAALKGAAGAAPLRGVASGAFSPTKRTFTFDSQALPALRTLLRIPRHEFGDTRYRRVTYNAVATSRFREYFIGVTTANERINPEVTRGEGDEKTTVIVDIPASARPAIPKIHSVIPTFKWDRSGSTSKRSGGFRVYLERPWWSSGDGEMLAVVLAPMPKVTSTGGDVTVEKPDPNFLLHYCTQWARDPLWTKAGGEWVPETVTDLRPNHFPLAAKTVPGPTSGLWLEESQAASVSIAPHAVQFDSSRNQWFCDIDISLPADAYFPFVRFALARYQPHALEGLNLSRVALADFSQLTPARSASVVKGGDATVVTVSGLNGNGNVVTARMERKTGDDKVFGWVGIGKAEELTASSASGVTTWSGDISNAGTGGPGESRVAIREYEVWETDGQPARRLVYAENIVL